MYITLEEYSKFYDPVEEKVFARLSYEAGRLMDNHTTGIDGVKKLSHAFPVDEGAAAAVKYCTAKKQSKACGARSSLGWKPGTRQSPIPKPNCLILPLTRRWQIKLPGMR